MCKAREREKLNSMHSPQRVILFDFDGVIVPTFDVGFQIARMRQPDVTETEYRQRFEGNINDPIKQVTGASSSTLARVDFWSLYTPKLLEREPIQGMKGLVSDLAEHYSLAIVSSTTSSAIQTFLEKKQMSNYFFAILGNDVSTSKIEKITRVIQERKISSSQCLFVTDTLGDLREAEAVAVSAIGVTWGFHDQATLEKGKTIAIVDTPEGLRAEIEKYFT